MSLNEIYLQIKDDKIVKDMIGDDLLEQLFISVDRNYFDLFKNKKNKMLKYKKEGIFKVDKMYNFKLNRPLELDAYDMAYQQATRNKLHYKYDIFSKDEISRGRFSDEFFDLGDISINKSLKKHWINKCNYVDEGGITDIYQIYNMVKLKQLELLNIDGKYKDIPLRVMRLKSILDVDIFDFFLTALEVFESLENLFNYFKMVTEMVKKFGNDIFPKRKTIVIRCRNKIDGTIDIQALRKELSHNNVSKQLTNKEIFRLTKHIWQGKVVRVTVFSDFPMEYCLSHCGINNDNIEIDYKTHEYKIPNFKINMLDNLPLKNMGWLRYINLETGLYFFESKTNIDDFEEEITEWVVGKAIQTDFGQDKEKNWSEGFRHFLTNQNNIINN